MTGAAAAAAPGDSQGATAGKTQGSLTGEPGDQSANRRPIASTVFDQSAPPPGNSANRSVCTDILPLPYCFQLR